MTVQAVLKNRALQYTDLQPHVVVVHQIRECWHIWDKSIPLSLLKHGVTEGNAK